MQNKQIQPFQVYTVDETAELVGMHPASLRRKLTHSNDPFIQNSKPVKIGKEWRFMGENILRALGSVSYAGETPQIGFTGNSGVPKQD